MTLLVFRYAVDRPQGIMHKISPLISPLRATPPVIGSEEERARREYTVQMSKRALIDLCQQESSKFLVAGRYDLAVPGAIQVSSINRYGGSRRFTDAAASLEICIVLSTETRKS